MFGCCRVLWIITSGNWHYDVTTFSAALS